MDPNRAHSFAAHPRTHLPPPHFDHRELEHPFYQAVATYLTQTTKGASFNDLRPSFTRIINSTFSWLPYLDSIDAAIEVASPRNGEIPFKPLHVFQPRSHLLAPLAHLQRPTSAQTAAAKEADNDEASSSGRVVSTQAGERTFARPGLWVIAHTLTFYAGKAARWQVASLVAEIQHYALDSRTKASSQATFAARAKALEAIAHTITFLAATWVEAGTWLGIAVANTKFSRICVLDCATKSKERPTSMLNFFGDAHTSDISSDTNDKITIALEVPPQTLLEFPNAVFDYSELFETKPTDAFYLLAHDLVASYDLTARPFMDLGSGQYTISHTSAKTLWTTLNLAVRALGYLPWGQPLDRLEPPSAPFQEYADKILRRAIPTQRPHLPLERQNSTEEDALPQEKIEFATTPVTPVPHQVVYSVPSIKDDDIRRWLSGTSSCAFSGSGDEQTKRSSEGPAKLDAPDATLNHTNDTRKIVVYYVSSGEMDRLVQMRTGHQLDDYTKRPFPTSCCFA